MFELAPIDYGIIAIYFAFCLWVGVSFKKKGEQHGMESYAVADRNLPWWLIGTSMVATTFSAETPLLVSGLVYTSGISRNWEWWCFLPGAMLTTFLFARLWRRTEVLTDAEYVALRYSGREARFLRGFRALYMGFIMNTIVLGSALVVSGKFGTTLLQIPETHPNYLFYRIAIALACGLVALFYSSLAGIAGIVITDFVQFSLAMIGSILVAVYALAQPQVGGLSGLIERIGQLRPGHLDFLPAASAGKPGAAQLTMGAVALFLSVRWWSQVYGGAEPGGASHVAQRMLSAKDEKNALLGTLWFNIAHYALRPWPWILTGLAAIILFPDLKDTDRAYIQSINFVPPGLKGLVLAGFFSALMAIDTRLNLGASYFVNDFYQPFIKPNQSDGHYVFVSRIITVVQLLCGLLMLLFVSSVKSVLFITLAIGSGAGLIYILRWYWWRVSAWSEMAAMIAGLVNLALFRFVVYPSEEVFNAHGIQVLIGSSIVVPLVWLTVTLLAPPTSREQLRIFYRKVRPAGPGWKSIRDELQAEGVDVRPGYDVGWAFACWALAVGMVYGALFGVGKVLLGQPGLGALFLAIAAGAGLALIWTMTHKMQWDEAAPESRPAAVEGAVASSGRG